MIYDSIIIGSGMAGLTAAIYLARAKKSVLIIEDAVIGGITATLDNIENYPGFTSISGLELVQNTLSQVSKLGVTIDMMHVESIDFDKKILKTDKTTLYYKTLIIASGTSYKALNLKEESDYKFKGLSYCAVCDGNLYRNKKIVVVTDGYSANESINYLSNLTKDIVIIDKGNKYKNINFKVFSNSTIIKINGKPFVESVDVKNDNNEIMNVECAGIFVSLGKETNLDLYKDEIEVSDNYIISDEDMHTNIEGVFVAGDIRKKSLRQIVTACADGAIAGTEAIKFLSKI